MSNICCGKHWNFHCSVGSPSVTQKEKVQQAKPQQAFQVLEPGKADYAYTNTSFKLEENNTEQYESKPDVSEQPNTSGVKEGEINLRPQTCPKEVDTNIVGFKSCWWYNSTWEDLLKGSGIKPEHFIYDVSVHEFWHDNPHLKRGEELEIKFISVASEDTTNAIKYPSFHFMKLQRPDKKTFTYIKEQETKSALVVNLTEDKIFTRRAWGIWGCLTEMDKVKYPFKIF
ncbi:hypothetical protein ACS0TY_024449 [Phlomoides rotata]